MNRTESFSEIRERFRQGPVGLWQTRLGGGFEMTHGTNLEFSTDGTGTEWHWGGGELDENDEVVEVSGSSSFTWRSIGDWQIEIFPADGQPVCVAYDFFERSNEYDYREICIYEFDHWSKRLSQENGFWISGYPLVLDEPAPRLLGMFERLSLWFRKRQ